MRNVRFPLSWKLTLCSILMMLLMWTAVGAVLVMSTAEEIMEAQDDEAQRRADMVMQYGGVDTIGYYYRLDQGDHWIEEAGQRRSEVLFPEENSSWPSRYSQYTVIRPISADYDSRTVWAETFLGIQVQGAPEGEPWNDQYLIFLENYSPDDLYAISELVNRGGGAAPIRAVGHADLRHRFFGRIPSPSGIQASPITEQAARTPTSSARAASRWRRTPILSAPISSTARVWR